MTGNDATGTAGLLPEGAVLRRVGSGATWSEGPVWMPESGRVRWSDIPGNRILEVDPVDGTVTVHRDQVEFTNGRTLDLAGDVVQCSHGRRAVERERAGEVTTLVSSYLGHRLNSPNDVVVASDGTIWFSDPPYGITVPNEGHPGAREYGDCFVFRLDPATEDLRPVVIDVEEPNGLAFSPDERLLYVSDTSAALRTDGGGNHHIRVYDVTADARCKNGRLFAEVEGGLADGFRVDEAGRVWTSAGPAVQVFDPQGALLLTVDVPEKVGNLCFGGTDGTDLYVAATTSIYHLPTLTRDATWTRRRS